MSISAEFIQREKMRGTNVFYSDQIDIVYGDRVDRRSIATYGLGGCTGLVVEFEDPYAIALGHFQPMTIRENKHIDQIENILTKATKRSKAIGGLLLHPGDEDADSITGYGAWSSYSDRVSSLTELIIKSVGEVPVISAGYYEVGRGGNIGPNGEVNIEQGTVIAELANDKVPPSIRVGGKPIDLIGAISKL